MRRSRIVSYDIWVDFMKMRNDGTLVARESDVVGGRRVTAGDVVTVGSEDSLPAKAKVMSIDVSGAIVLQVLDVARGFAASA